MKKIATLIIAAMLFILTAMPAMAGTSQPNACWGQATKVFAKAGEMGLHASSQDTPRIGLHNLAVLLFEAGIIDDDSMAALGQFVAADLGLSIDACMD